MVMLRAARAGLGTPWLASFMLGLAVTATLAANVGYGLPHGLPGALLSGWPAVAFIGCAEMTISAVRRMRPSAGGGMVPAPVPTDAENAALMALRHHHGGQPAVAKPAHGTVRAHPRAGDDSAPAGDRRVRRQRA